MDKEHLLMRQAIDAFDAKNYAAAKAIWDVLSLSNADAMVNLGTMYVRGYGVGRSIETALELFECAASMGHPVASFYLGGMYENGIGVLAEREHAIAHYTVAAESGVSGAQLKLGILLRHDDPKSAMAWMIRAAHAGESQAQSLLTYVSNRVETSDINVGFRRLDETAQRRRVEEVIADRIAPILAHDGGGVELLRYVGGDTPEIWLCYLGACSGCHLGRTSTAGMILEEFENLIDKNIAIYLW